MNQKHKYLSAKSIAELWRVSERSVRNYCAEGRVEGAYLEGKTWKIPSDAKKPERINKKSADRNGLLKTLKAEKSAKLRGGIYHKIQVDLTYNSNHIEGSRLTHDETRYIFETNTIGKTKGSLNVDDIIETTNHFRCIDMIIDSAGATLSEMLIKRLHATLKAGTSDSQQDWFAVGAYKKLPNEVGGQKTTAPDKVSAEMKKLLASYNAKDHKTFKDLLDFHYKFEKIHPFQDGNGRVGRLILFKECLGNNIVPFIIDDELKLYYYRGLKEWKKDKAYLMDTCLLAQDEFKEILDYFDIPYSG